MVKNISLVVVASILFVGCSEHRQAQRSRPVPAAPEIRAESRSDLRQAGSEHLRQATAVLQQLTSTSAEPLPDAVLSRAKCLVLLPSSGPHELATVACRKGNGWSAPTFAKVRGAATIAPQGSASTRKELTPGQRGDLLIFMMSDRGLAALLSGSIRLGSDVTVDAGPPLDAGPIVTDVELKASDAVAYVHNGGKLRPVKVTSGSLQLDGETSKQMYGRAVTPQTLLQGANVRNADTSFNGMVNSFFYLIRPSGIILHHSVLLPEPAVAEQVLDDFHSKRGFSIYCFGRVYHVAYHFMVLPDGTVKAGRPERCQGAHTRGYNSYLGIALVGDFSSDDNPKGLKGDVTPTAAQVRSLLKLCRELRQRYNIPLHRIVRHSDISPTRCPGDRFLFKEFLARLEQPNSSGL